MTTRHVKIGEVVEPIKRSFDVVPGVEYHLVGVKWWGKGAFLRESKFGDSIKKTRQYEIRAGDIVYNKLFAWRGGFAVVPDELDGCTVSDKFPTYRLRSEEIRIAYLRVLFRSRALARQAESMSTGMAAMSKFTLNPPKFAELTIPIPSVDQQDKIVSRFEEIDYKTNVAQKSQERLYVNAGYLRRAAIESWMAQCSRVRLGELGTLVRRNVRIEEHELYQFITIGMENRGVRFRGEKGGQEVAVKRQCRVRAGDLVFSRIDIRNGAIGFVPMKLDGCVVGNDFPVFELNADVSREFLEWSFWTAEFREECKRQSAGSTNRKKMTREAFLNLNVPCPSRRIQDDIANRIRRLSEKVEHISNAAGRTAEHLRWVEESVLRNIYEDGQLSSVGRDLNIDRVVDV